MKREKTPGKSEETPEKTGEPIFGGLKRKIKNRN